MAEPLTPEQAKAEVARKLARDVRHRRIAAVISVDDNDRAAKLRRAWLWQLMSDAGIFTTSFGSGDAVTNFNEGRRSVGLKILTDVMDASPDGFLLMQREHAEAVRQRREEHETPDE